jgi:hypothetical protein
MRGVSADSPLFFVVAAAPSITKPAVGHDSSLRGTIRQHTALLKQNQAGDDLTETSEGHVPCIVTLYDFRSAFEAYWKCKGELSPSAAFDDPFPTEIFHISLIQDLNHQFLIIIETLDRWERVI